MEQVLAQQTEWTFDPDHTVVEFTAKHMMVTTVRGRFREVLGGLRYDAEDPASSSVEVRIAAATIDTGVGARDAHLRSGDFLEVEAHPELTFRSRRLEGGFRMPGDRFRIVGDLTLRGVTREVSLDARFEGEGMDPDGFPRLAFTAETRIDRRDFGLNWNAALETGGILVSNEVRIHVEVSAVPAQ